MFAPHYAAPMPKTAGRTTPLLAQAGDADSALSEVLAGEPFEVLEVSGGWLWGISPVDGVVGYVDEAAFIAAWAPGHVVVARRAPVRADVAPDSRVLLHLPMGTRLAASRANDDTMEVDGGFVDADCLRPLDDLTLHPADVAERLIGAPRAAGGRSGAGVDGPGLAFLALALSGIEAGRFCSSQGEVGTAVPTDDALARHDLVVFADHVAVMVDGATAIHVGADAVERVSLDQLIAAEGAVLARRRP